VSGTLLKALVGLVPATVLFTGALALFSRERNFCSFLQLMGAGSLVVVVLSHVAEALRLFPSMHWGQEQSVGHYLDLWSAVLGLTLFPAGYLLQTLARAPNTRSEKAERAEGRRACRVESRGEE
jgi:hypothetical protein